MNAQKFVSYVWVLGLAGASLLIPSQRASAQMGIGEASAAMNMNDNLNGGSTGGASSGVAGLALQRARQAAGTAGGYNTNMQGAMNGAQGGMQPGGMMPPGAPMASGITAQQAAAFAAAAAAPKITVITGTRIFDVVTGELIDDVIRKKRPETEKAEYFDDGTHGDLTPGDEVYTRVDGEKREALSASNQKVKEQLVSALRVAEAYTPVEFYGFSLMSTDRQEPVPRNEAWKVVKDPKGIGYQLSEVPVDTPLQVPKFRDKLKEKDHTVKSDWSLRFLNDYRKKKDDLSSEFYPVYIPTPPQPPTSVPPVGWIPFADPTAQQRQDAMSNPLMRMQMMMQNGGMGGGMGGEMGGGMGGGGNMGGGGGRRGR